uniref:Uncharacterized protein n=1 Tax=Anguilla anguilla TaxID=7936 RepID=A0A0E9PHV8_ANGAN
MMMRSKTFKFVSEPLWLILLRKLYCLTSLLTAGIPHSFVMMSYQYKSQDEDQTKIKGSVKYRTPGLSGAVSVSLSHPVTFSILWPPDP